jgi:hypothetical protein
MKKLFFIFTATVSIFFSARTALAQSIRLDNIAPFPDTVIAGEVVNMTLYISNNGGTTFNSDLAVLIHSDSSVNPPDTMFYDSSYQLTNAVTDTIGITYTFNAADFEAGDNIVVVWPVSSQASAMVDPDSLVFTLIVLPNGIATNIIQPVAELFPNPAKDMIRIRFSHPEKVEQVRVFDMLGIELLRFGGVVTEISTQSLQAGVYVIEVLNKDRSVIVKKFLRE